MRLFKKSNPTLQEIQLPEKNLKLRVILLCVAATIAVTAFGIFLSEALRVESGWQTVEVSGGGLHCGGDITFQYYYDEQLSSAATRKLLVDTYSAAAREAYWMFTPDQPDEQQSNVYCINHRVGQVVTVPPALYNAFALTQQYGDRQIYLGPVYRVYQNLCYAADDVQAQTLDPELDADMQAYVATLAAFAGDENAITLELLGENQVRLLVSQAYQDFARENELENYLDFAWMTNAFIVDHLTQRLQEQGFTQGCLVSQDGFVRSLCDKEPFGLNLYDREGTSIHPMAVTTCAAPISILNLRDYPANQWCTQHYYMYEDGQIRSRFVELTDGRSRCGTSDLTAYSATLGCGALALRIAPTFVRQTLDTQTLCNLAQEGIYAVWAEDLTVYYTDPQLVLENLLQEDACTYRSQLMQAGNGQPNMG